VSSPTRAEQLPTLSKYELIEELGHGGMATVYRARDIRLDREVAVKIIHKHLRESAEVGTRFAAEAKAVAKLRHPNIVEVYDVSAEDEVEKYLVVELSRGISLRRALAKYPDMPPEVAAGIGLELASALAHAHAAGVVHRDIKPENVLIETPSMGDPKQDVLVKLTDFGIAKILDAQGVTSTGQVLGSPAHMAPEQIEGGEVDGRADVFGMGVLLYECMVGHLPFEGKNPAQVLRRVLEGSYAAADREKPMVGGRWARILARALARESSERYPTAEALLKAIQVELDALGMADHQKELRAFFGDPEKYRQELPARLVPVLTRRGEEARKARDQVGAAADFNRALAYAPRDPALPRLISRLHRGRARRRAAYLVLSIVAGSTVLGASAYVIGRSLRKPPVVPADDQQKTAPVLALTPSSNAVLSPSSTKPATSASATPRSPTSVVRRPAEPPVSATRDVQFVVHPKGAEVSIDDGPLEDIYGQSKRLEVGAHQFRAEVRKSKCCQVLTKRVEIRADNGSNEPQIVQLSLQFNSATLSVVEAPQGAELRCPGLRISGPASRIWEIPMTAPELDVSCDLDAPGVSTRSTSINLRAGEPKKLTWSAP
jgi:serine/threonine-protein kinase